MKTARQLASELANMIDEYDGDPPFNALAAAIEARDRELIVECASINVDDALIKELNRQMLWAAESRLTAHGWAEAWRVFAERIMTLQAPVPTAEAAKEPT